MHGLVALVLAVQPLPAAASNAGGQADPDIAAVIGTVNALRAAVVAHDGAAVLAVIRADGEATVVAQGPDGSYVIRHPSWPQFVAGIRPGPERFDPRFHDITVRVDGPIAVAWTPYEFFVDGSSHHCGANHFDLVREGGSWKILNITYSYRTQGCAAARG